MKTLTKSMFLSLCLYSFSALPSSLSTEAIAQAYEDRNGPAKYLELYFVVQPNNALKSASCKIYTYGLSAIAAAYLLYSNTVGEIFTQAQGANAKESKLSLATIAPVFAAGTLTKGIYDWYLGYIEQSIKYDCLTAFLTNWNIHRSHVPTVLVPLFDELAKKFASSKTLSSEIVDQVYELVNHIIEHEFPARYKNETKFESSLQITKVITDIYKNVA